MAPTSGKNIIAARDLPRDGGVTPLPNPDAQPILSRLGVTGSLRRELEALLAAAPPDAAPADYRRLLLDQNAAGKGSAAQRLQVWHRLKLRYLLDPDVPEFRAFLAAMDSAATAAERGLLACLLFARTDRLFREVTLACVSPLLAREGTPIEPESIGKAIRARADASGRAWSPTTLARARAHLLGALKDFGLLRGRLVKRTLPPRPGPAVTLFAARLARLEGLTDRQVLEACWFRILGLDVDRVVDLMYAAARSGALGFRQQADVVELTLPALDPR